MNPHVVSDDCGLRLLVVQPDPLGPLDRWAGWLAESNLAVRVLRPFRGDRLPDALADDGLVVLGGDMSAMDDEEYPWLVDIRHLLRQAVELGRPALGICLGGQLLARTFGGTVVRGDRGVEAGAVRIRWRSEAATDPLFGGLPAPFVSAACHRDMIESLPATAVWLGDSEMYPHQAFRVGPLAWGVQFHPEASLAGYRHWLVAAAEASRTAELERLRRGLDDMERLDGEVAAGTAALARRFADLVRTTARQRGSLAGHTGPGNCENVP